MSNRVQGQNRRKRPVDIFFEFVQVRAKFATLLYFGLGKRRGNAEQYRFPDRTQEGKHDRHEKKDDYQCVHDAFDKSPDSGNRPAVRDVT